MPFSPGVQAVIIFQLDLWSSQYQIALKLRIPFLRMNHMIIQFSNEKGNDYVIFVVSSDISHVIKWEIGNNIN